MISSKTQAKKFISKMTETQRAQKKKEIMESSGQRNFICENKMDASVWRDLD